MTKIYSRETKDFYEQKITSNLIINFLYKTIIGRLFLKVIISTPISKLSSKYNNSKQSLKKINKYIKKNRINMDDYLKEEYLSFNDFLIRNIKDEKRPMTSNPKRFISPADSKVLVYNITKDLKININSSNYSLNELVNNEEVLSEFINGKCLIFRLSNDDYQHYCYPDSGSLLKYNSTLGKLNILKSLSTNYKLFKKDQIEYSILNTDNFDKIVFVEVGALTNGTIINNPKSQFIKGEEKGYFKKVNSTIVILIKENQIILDKDIINNSKNNIETQVKYHETIGAKR